MFVNVEAAFEPIKADLITKVFSCKNSPPESGKKGVEENERMYEYLLDNCEQGRATKEGHKHYISRQISKGEEKGYFGRSYATTELRVSIALHCCNS